MVARRIAAITLSIFKKQKPYDDKFEEKRKNNLKHNKINHPKYPEVRI